MRRDHAPGAARTAGGGGRTRCHRRDRSSERARLARELASAVLDATTQLVDAPLIESDGLEVRKPPIRRGDDAVDRRSHCGLADLEGGTELDPPCSRQRGGAPLYGEGHGRV